VTNGGFESGNFTGWTVVNQAGGNGNWFNYTGTSSPASGHTIPAPPEGTRAAITDQGAPGSHELYQDIVLAPREGPAVVLRINGDGTFRPISPVEGAVDLRDSASADRDGDGDPDAAAPDARGPPRSHDNERAGRCGPPSDPKGAGGAAPPAAARVQASRPRPF